MIPQDLAQGAMNEVGGGVVSSNASTMLLVDLEFCLLPLSWLPVQSPSVKYDFPSLLYAFYLKVEIPSANGPDVADLPTALGIERTVSSRKSRRSVRVEIHGLDHCFHLEALGYIQEVDVQTEVRAPRRGMPRQRLRRDSVGELLV